MADPSTKLPPQNQTVLITGGSGLVGAKLSKLLSEQGYTVTHLSRSKTSKGYETFQWDIQKGEIEPEAIKGANSIIHLAGASVAEKRWTKSWKQEIYDSRIESTRLLREAALEHNPNLKHFICASAIGFYGWDSGNEMVEETHARGEGFLVDVVDDWEKEALRFEEHRIDTSIVRVGIVLSETGGALEKMAQPIKLGLGAALGSGDQFMSWIHLEDLCGIFSHVLSGGLSGIFNGVAPSPETNRDLTKKLAKAFRKPLFLPNVPPFALRLLVGEMSDILLGGNRVSSKKIESTGFNFRFPSLDSALKDLVKKDGR